MAPAKSDTTPYWSTATTFPQFAKLADSAEADVVVVGGGITGLTAAYLLREGRQTRHRARTWSLCGDRHGTYQRALDDGDRRAPQRTGERIGTHARAGGVGCGARRHRPD